MRDLGRFARQVGDALEARGDAAGAAKVRSAGRPTAGGGVRRSSVYGATDELGFTITERPVHVHDLNATILHLLGLEHTRLTFRHQGRDYRLTDVHGEIVRGILA